MVVGKTYPSVTANDVLNRYNETDILSAYLGITEIPCLICSPLRTDRHPSFHIYLNKCEKVRYKDYATGEHGDVLSLLCRYWNCSFLQAVTKIYKDFIEHSDVRIKPKRAKTFTKKDDSGCSKIEVRIRPWEDYDFTYWSSYGITPKWLSYAEVYPISHKIVTKTDRNKKMKSRTVFKADRYAYVFVERKERKLQLKIYQPFNVDGFKWCSKMDGSVISLWMKIPERGDRVVICSSLKDALCVSCQLHIPAIALQGEGYSISDTAVKELKRRYNKVFISFDTDTAGINDGKSLAEQTGFINVIPDLGDCKDYSDYYKSLSDKNDFQKLKTLFN